MKNIQFFKMDFKKPMMAGLWMGLLFFAFSGLQAQCPGMNIEGPVTIGDVGSCTPTSGMMQWNGTTLQVYDGSTWINIPASGSGGSGYWLPNTEGIHYDEVIGDNVGIGTSNPLSKLSVGGDGDATATVSIYTPSSSASSRQGVYSEAGGTSGFASHTRAIYGRNVGGYGYSYGVYGSAISPTPSTNGRTYGIYGIAGDANVNYGVYGRVIGEKRGSAILGYDNVDNPGWSGVIDGNWAGYFIGKGHFSDKVAIGTTTIPTTAGTLDVSNFNLFVKGGILTEEVVVRLCADWADYVFAPDYDLKSLEEVEAIIEQEGHLHNTPSAQEIEANGIQVSTMMVNQQEKIEELFLHLIDMKKDMDALKAENVALKAEVKTLER